ncbi:MAG: hypothetical protein ACON35_02145 [Candidatus Marinamargulisbacteria bacterium]
MQKKTVAMVEINRNPFTEYIDLVVNDDFVIFKWDASEGWLFLNKTCPMNVNYKIYLDDFKRLIVFFLLNENDNLRCVFNVEKDKLVEFEKGVIRLKHLAPYSHKVLTKSPECCQVQ